MTTHPYDVGHFNGGQRDWRDLARFWLELLEGKHTPRPLAALHLNEIGDQDRAVAWLEDHGYPVVARPREVPDGLKDGIALNPFLVELLWERTIKIGDAFEGRRRRNGKLIHVRMANKYAHIAHVRHIASQRTPMHLTTHVWPSVYLPVQRPHAKAMLANLAAVMDDLTGVRIESMDQNTGIGRAGYADLIAPMRLVARSAQEDLGPVGTWGKAPIDDFWTHHGGLARRWISTVDMPGAERTGGEHLALILHGALIARP